MTTIVNSPSLNLNTWSPNHLTFSSKSSFTCVENFRLAVDFSLLKPFILILNFGVNADSYELRADASLKYSEFIIQMIVVTKLFKMQPRKQQTFQKSIEA